MLKPRGALVLLLRLAHAADCAARDQGPPAALHNETHWAPASKHEGRSRISPQNV